MTAVSKDASPSGTLDRLRAAAIRLIRSRGYEHVTVEAIAQEAGTSRRTFFRYYSSKQDVLLPNHARILEAVRAELSAPVDGATPVEVVVRAVRIIHREYVADPAASVTCFKLVRSIPELREREMAWASRYQRVLALHLRTLLPDQPLQPLEADVVAAAVLAAHNHALRTWLLGGGLGDPQVELESAMAYVVRKLSEGTPRISG